MKVTTKVRFLDSRSKQYISRRLKDACKKVIDEYNENETIKSPMIKIGIDKDGNWDTRFTDSTVKFNRINLLDYANENGELNFSNFLKDTFAFLTPNANVQDDVLELSMTDEDEEDTDEDDDEEEPGDNSGDEGDEDSDEGTEEPEKKDQTYAEYLRDQLDELGKDDFRRYLIKIILKESKGWAYIKHPKNVEGDEYDVVTPKNAKKIQKIFSEGNK